MKKRVSFIKFIQLWGIVFLLVVGGSIIVLDIIISYRDFNLQSEQIRNNYIIQQKEMIKREVNQVVAMINYEKAQRETVTRTEIKSRIYEAYAITDHIYQQNKDSKSKAEIKQMILDALRPIRFMGGRGYYFVSSIDGTMKLDPFRSELEGIQQLNTQDPKGQYIARDMIKIVQQSGEGFYEYHWTKPGEVGNDFKKIAFVKYFAPFDWFMGAGLYVDDVEAQTKADLLSTISRVRFGKEGYIFVNRLNGDALVSNGKHFNGSKKLWQVFNKDPERIKAVFDKEYKAAAKPGGDFIYYSWIKLSDTKQESPKTSFIYGLPELQWLVGAGVYLDDVESDIAVMNTRLNRKNKTKILSFALLLLGMLALFLFFFRRLNRKLKNDFNLFSTFFERAARSDETINRDKVQFDELDRLAKDANLMLEEKINVNQELMNEREALLESEKKYREMANLLPQMVYETGECAILS